MARTLSIKCTNMKAFDKFVKKLEKAIPEVSKDTVQTATMAIEADAKQFAPVDTGRLRDSINSKIEVDNDSVTGIVSTDVYYSKYVEFGTSKMAAKPYMKPAFDKNKDDIENYFVEKLKKKVK